MYYFKEGEQAMINYLLAHNYKVQDVSDNSDYWNKDIDLLVETAEGQLGIEVKWDTRIAQTGNLFLEMYNMNSVGGCGWVKFCDADYLAYGDARNRIFYIVKMDELKEFLSRFSHNLNIAKAGNSEGLLLSLDTLNRNLKVETIKLRKDDNLC